MKTKAVRIYGKNDLRLEEFELPPLAGGRDPGPRDLRLHLHVQPQGGAAGRGAQARAQGRRPEPDHHRPRVRRHPRGSRQEMEEEVQGGGQVLHPAGPELQGLHGRPRLLLPLHRRGRHLRDHPQRGHGDGLPAAVHRPGLLPRLALRAGVLHRRRLPRQLPPGPGLLRAPHGHQAQGDHGPAGRGGPHGPGGHRLGPALRQRQLPAPPAGGDGHRRQPPGAGPQVLPARGRRQDRRAAGVREHPGPAGRPRRT